MNILLRKILQIRKLIYLLILFRLSEENEGSELWKLPRYFFLILNFLYLSKILRIGRIPVYKSGLAVNQMIISIDNQYILLLINLMETFVSLT